MLTKMEINFLWRDPGGRNEYLLRSLSKEQKQKEERRYKALLVNAGAK